MDFPIAIPCGGIAAAPAAGNIVIFKPASDTVLVAWELCQCFWRAGVPPKALQLLPCGERGGDGLANDFPRLGIRLAGFLEEINRVDPDREIQRLGLKRVGVSLLGEFRFFSFNARACQTWVMHCAWASRSPNAFSWRTNCVHARACKLV